MILSDVTLYSFQLGELAGRTLVAQQHHQRSNGSEPSPLVKDPDGE